MRGNDLQKLELTVNNFISDKEIQDIKLFFQERDFICLVIYKGI